MVLQLHLQLRAQCREDTLLRLKLVDTPALAMTACDRAFHQAGASNAASPAGLAYLMSMALVLVRSGAFLADFLGLLILLAIW